MARHGVRRGKSHAHDKTFQITNAEKNFETLYAFGLPGLFVELCIFTTVGSGRGSLGDHLFRYPRFVPANSIEPCQQHGLCKVEM
jgi:hypothetical protein